MINTGGEKVAPGEVTAELEGCPGVREAVVIGEPDPEWGDRVTAIVVPADPGNPPELPALRAAVTRRMPHYAAPRAMVLVAEVPLLPLGKPDVAALRALAAQSQRWQHSERQQHRVRQQRAGTTGERGS